MSSISVTLGGGGKCRLLEPPADLGKSGLVLLRNSEDSQAQQVEETLLREHWKRPNESQGFKNTIIDITKDLKC